MRKMLVVSAMGLLALGIEAGGARPLPVPNAARFTEYVQASSEAGDDLQAPWVEEQIQAP